MNNELAFSIANLIALIGWIFLIILPNHKVTKGLVHKGTISLLLSIGYLGYAVVGSALVLMLISSPFQVS